MRSLLSKRGIVIDVAAAKAPEQNGIIERNVRTVGEKMRTLTLQSGIETKYWPLVLSHAIMLLNFTPNKVAGVSAHEAIYKTPPPISNLHPFGCRALWLDPQENKLDSRASEGIYVGSTSGGFLIFNPVTKRIITRRDVKIISDEFPLLRSIQHAIYSISPRREALNALHGPDSVS